MCLIQVNVVKEYFQYMMLEQDLNKKMDTKEEHRLRCKRPWLCERSEQLPAVGAQLFLEK